MVKFSFFKILLFFSGFFLEMYCNIINESGASSIQLSSREMRWYFSWQEPAKTDATCETCCQLKRRENRLIIRLDKCTLCLTEHALVVLEIVTIKIFSQSYSDAKILVFSSFALIDMTCFNDVIYNLRTQQVFSKHDSTS